MGGGTASVTWRKPREREPDGITRFLGTICLVLGSIGVVLGITLSTISLVAQAMEGDVVVLRAAFAILILAGCLVLAGVRLRQGVGPVAR